jgi:hypothetical protein
MLIGKRKRGIMLTYRWHMTYKSKNGSIPAKKCVAVIKNTIEPAIMGSIQECDTVTEYLKRIKSQLYGSSKTYATQIIKQLVREKYTGGENGNDIREHMSKMNHLNNKLKPMDLDLKEEFLVHLIFASLPKKSLTHLLSTIISSPKNGIYNVVWQCVCKKKRE